MKKRGKQQTLDRNTEKRRSEHKGKEKKRKAAHAPDTNAENRRKEDKERKRRGKQHMLRIEMLRKEHP